MYFNRIRAPSGILDPSLYGVDKLPADAKIPLAGLLSVKGKTHATPAEITQLLRDMYCGTIGVEYTHAEVTKSYYQGSIIV
jgi:2-oxoglutarate dehydrogenase complex dehydrogenase (E1) component-like enzyme